MVLDFRRIRERGLTLRVIWDLFMILIAIVNLLLIIFDWSYFYVRPYLRAQLPAVTQLYDPYKAVEAHPKTTRYTKLAGQLHDAAVVTPPTRASVARAERLQAELAQQAADFTVANPFESSGQSQHLQTMHDRLLAFLDEEANAGQPVGALDFADVSNLFWEQALAAEPTAARIYFDDQIQPLLEDNYLRQRALNGEYEDYFILLDAPFLLLFFVEFMARWAFALRRRELPRWWLFPVYNWYDVLGLIPFAEFRIFRLFRVLSIYVRLHRSDLTNIGDDIVSRTIKRYSAILTEEVSDRVAARILSEMQDEIQRGASIDIFLKALEPRRADIKTLVLRYARTIADKQPGQAQTRRLLASSLEDAARAVPSLQLVPDFIKERLTREIGVAVYDGINATLAGAIQGEGGAELVNEIVDTILDDVLREGQGSAVDQLYRQISLDVLENMKVAVAEKKWTRD